MAIPFEKLFAGGYDKGLGNQNQSEVGVIDSGPPIYSERQVEVATVKGANGTPADELAAIARAVEEAMEGYLAHDPMVPKSLHEAMLYSLRAGGKRLRPIMVVLACETCRGERVVALPAAAAMEMIHTYSLIHDDLPAMDNDDYRRGKPTNHRVFGDDIAILAGDALLTCAFGTLAQHVRDGALVKRLIAELAQAAGAAGMIGGQVADIRAAEMPATLETVAFIHTHKTAMLFRAAARMGALCAGAGADETDVLSDYGLKFGLAYQIIDDLLDITGTAEQLGKSTQKDAEAGKMTYPGVIGVAESQRQADKLIGQAIAAIEQLGAAAEPLRYLARIACGRTN